MNKLIEYLTRGLIPTGALWVSVFISYIMFFLIPTLLGQNIGLSTDQLLEKFSHFFDWKLALPLMFGYLGACFFCKRAILYLDRKGKNSSRIRNGLDDIHHETASTINGLSLLSFLLMMAEISLHGFTSATSMYLRFFLVFKGLAAIVFYLKDEDKESIK